MRIILKSTLFITFAFSGFNALAQENTLENLVSSKNESAAAEISDDVIGKAGPSAEGARAFITKAERQSIGRLKNVYKIDEGIYRSEQPDQNDFVSFKKAGLAEVLNLRRFWKDDKKARKTDLKLHHISMKAGDINERDVIKALKLINDRKGPMLIHCWHGSDRTGMLIAMYRVIFQNWAKDDAIHEMTKGNFGFHTVYSNLIDFVRDADIDKMKEKIMGKKEAEKLEETVAMVADPK